MPSVGLGKCGLYMYRACKPSIQAIVPYLLLLSTTTTTTTITITITLHEALVCYSSSINELLSRTVYFTRTIYYFTIIDMKLSYKLQC